MPKPAAKQHDDEVEIVSKTRIKKDMLALQELGEAMIELPADKLKELALPENLHTAIVEAKRITKHGALSRQQQYIGKLMRNVDAEPIRLKMEEWGGKAGRETGLFHLAERWRNKLLDDETAFTDFATEFPRADLQHLRNLVRQSKHEIEAKKPLTNFRNLFREIHEVVKREKM